MEFKATITMDSLAEMLSRRSLEERGRAQQVLDTAVLASCDPYIPIDTGALRDSGPIHTDIGSGLVQYITPYAMRQYYTNKGGNGKEGKLWFERAKADCKDRWLKEVANVCGGEID